MANPKSKPFKGAQSSAVEALITKRTPGEVTTASIKAKTGKKKASRKGVGNLPVR